MNSPSAKVLRCKTLVTVQTHPSPPTRIRSSVFVKINIFHKIRK